MLVHGATLECREIPFSVVQVVVNAVGSVFVLGRGEPPSRVYRILMFDSESGRKRCLEFDGWTGAIGRIQFIGMTEAQTPCLLVERRCGCDTLVRADFIEGTLEDLFTGEIVGGISLEKYNE